METAVLLTPPVDQTHLNPTAKSAVLLEPRGSTIVVLLVDDQVIVSEVVRRSLCSDKDIEFHYCSDPTQAIQMAMAVKPTVILQDLVMPEVDGLMLLRWFRMNPVTQHVPMIVLSNKEDAMMKAEAFTHGANDYLIKLPDPIELVARIRYHAQAYQNFQALSAATSTAQAKTRELEQALEQLQSTQAQLIQIEKMAGLGQMVAGIAHEINNPVNFIQGNIKHVQEYFGDLLSILDIYQASQPKLTSEQQEQIDEIDLDYLKEDSNRAMSSMRKGVERIGIIVKSLRNFARLDQAEQKEVDLHEGLESTLMLLQHRLGSNINITRNYGKLPLVQCFPAQLNQVFMHLVNNSIDALRDQGPNPTKQIVITTMGSEGAGLGPTGGQYVRLEFRDNGHGVPPEIQDQIFNPFFTTKPVDEGKGLGLSVSYRIIHEHQGQIKVISEPGLGACFTVELPVFQPGFQ
jgi:two-component system, NtrC family, sensor kinase